MFLLLVKLLSSSSMPVSFLNLFQSCCDLAKVVIFDFFPFKMLSKLTVPDFLLCWLLCGIVFIPGISGMQFINLVKFGPAFLTPTTVFFSSISSAVMVSIISFFCLVIFDDKDFEEETMLTFFDVSLESNRF